MTLTVGVVLLLALGLLAAVLKVPYVTLSPGPTINTLGSVNGVEVIKVSGHNVNRTTGHFNLTTVGVMEKLDLFAAIRGWFDSNEAVVPRAGVIPPGVNEKEVERQNTQEFVESQSAAESAALGELGFPAQVTVTNVANGAPAAGKLQNSDVITSINNTKISSSQQLISELTGIKAGSAVNVGYQRNGKSASTQITTSTAPGRSGSALGVTVSTERKAPFDIKIELGEIGGPSAGLMFALGILAKVGPSGDLTGGKFIAGTGTINPDGEVGQIGGIGQKLIAARNAGATVFLVPADNCGEAKDAAPAGLQLIKVENLHGAVQSLNQLNQGKTPPSC